MEKSVKISLILILLVSGSIHSIKAQTAESPVKKFSFSFAIDPSFGDYLGVSSVFPPSAIYLEKGIAGITSLGLGIGADLQKSESDYVRTGIGINARFAGYAFQIMEKISGNPVNSYGLEPFAAVTFGQFYTISSVQNGDPVTFSYNKLGFNLGTRWYPGNRRGFGLLAEYSTVGNTGRGSSINVGITLGR
ncbi:hypothetical protein [Lunatibacter salilacus]|uniref:hypothetical protein n=1 Tax=Lunatibacter salilacus TaxID=2483804 RepID=UPI00131D396D|nr:hypothetical protein [Lunatibacter salilacus]